MDFARATSYAKNLFVPLTRIACSWGGSTAALESLLTPAERWRMSAVEGRTEVRIAGPDFRFCEGFRMTAHRDDSACTGAVVRKPPVKERAGDEAPAVTRALW